MNSPDEIQLRDAEPEDLRALQEFLRPFVKAECILPRSDEDLLTLIRHGFVAETLDKELAAKELDTKEPAGTELETKVHAKIVGFAAIEIYSKKLAEVQALAVSTEFQRRGIGNRLVKQCVDRSKREGILELMAITVSEALFHGAGFDYSLPNQKRAVFLQTRDRA